MYQNDPYYPKRPLVWILLIAGQVAFTDNAARFLLTGLAEDLGLSWLKNIVAIMLVLPFVLFAPVAGWFSDRFSKKHVINAALIAQIVLSTFVVLALWAEQLVLALLAFGLLGIQSAFFGPAKMGIVKEVVTRSRFGYAIGLMGMVTIASILAGQAIGGVAFDTLTANGRDDLLWRGTATACFGLVFISVLAWIRFQRVPATPRQTAEPFRASMFLDHVRHLGELVRDRNLFHSSLGNAYFYAVGSFAVLTIIDLGWELAPKGAATSLAGILSVAIGVGIMVGSFITALLNRGKIEGGLIPVGAMGVAAFMFVFGMIEPSPASLGVVLFLMGMFAGMFVIPVQAYLQELAPDAFRARILAANNLLTNVTVIFAVLLHLVVSQGLGWSAQAQMLFLAALALGVAVYSMHLMAPAFWRFVARIIVHTFYRIERSGLEHIPEKGGAILICNHVSYADAVLLAAACPRRVRFLGGAELMRSRLMQYVFEVFEVIPVSSKRAKHAIAQAVVHARNGDIVCIFPEGQLTRLAQLLKFQRGYELIAKKAGVPILPAVLDKIWGSIFSFDRHKYFWKLPRRIPYHVRVAFGPTMDVNTTTPSGVRQTIMDMQEAAFSERAALKRHLADVVFQSLAKHPKHVAVVDYSTERRELKAGELLAMAMCLAKRWKTLEGKRVGVVFPPGIGAAVTNLGLLFAGKTPVNLNFTAGKAANEICINRAGIKHIISTAAVKQKLRDFPWPDDMIDILRERQQVGKPELAKWVIGARILPAGLLARLAGVPKEGDREEAGLLFSSGSTGEPKGIPLTHRNILTNCEQIRECDVIPRGSSALASLPVFHSFGFTVTLWYTLVEGVTIVAVPSPLDGKKIGEAVANEQCEVILGTPTFYRSYFKKIKPEQFKPLKYAIAGAEKTPAGMHERWEDTYGSLYLEGYGLTETSPVVGVNLPDRPVPDRHAAEQPSRRTGSVGRLLPGMSARIVDPVTGEDRSIFESGLLLLKGGNVFEGYLEDPGRTADVLVDGWFRTGDLGRFDEDGFLYIEGRLSRFSKIGGEMVPHGTLETHITEAYGMEDAERPTFAVAGVESETKGEAIVLLTTIEIDPAELRKKLADRGVPNLWHPREIVRIDEIPCLGTGKLDIRGVIDVARERAKG